MQMLKKIFNSESKYYLELDEIQESQPVQAAVKTAKKAASVVQNQAEKVLESEPVQQAVETTKQAADAAQDKLQSAVNTEAKPQAKSSKKDAEKSQKAPEAKAKPSPQDAGASSFEPPFWVAAMYNNSTTTAKSNGAQAEQTFATDNLMPTVTKYRRRPGPSLNKFKDMASKAKTPKG